MELVWPAVCFAAFLGLYALLHRRAGGGPIQWRWLAAIAFCAGVAMLISALDG
jgi:hypothetical protein